MRGGRGGLESKRMNEGNSWEAAHAAKTLEESDCWGRERESTMEGWEEARGNRE